MNMRYGASSPFRYTLNKHFIAIKGYNLFKGKVMRLLAFVFILALMSESLYALTPSERTSLLAKVKATKKTERKALSRHISRFKQSRNIRSRTFINRKQSMKHKQRIKRQIRLKRTRPKRVP